MKKKTDVCDSQWFKIGVRYAEGSSRISEFPPTPNFYLGVVSVIAGNPNHWLWSEPDHQFWRKLGMQFASGAIKPALFSKCRLPANAQMWEGILSADAGTRSLGLDEVIVHSGRVSKGTRPVSTKFEQAPHTPEGCIQEMVLFA